MAVFRTIPEGDLKLENGTFVFIEGPQEIRQRLSARFHFYLGEWFLDTRQGIPYYRDVLVKDPNLDLIRSLFRRVIVTTPGVLSLTSMTLNYNDSERHLDFGFEAKVTGGSVVVQPGDKDFLVSLAA